MTAIDRESENPWSSKCNTGIRGTPGRMTAGMDRESENPGSNQETGGLDMSEGQENQTMREYKVCLSRKYLTELVTRDRGYIPGGTNQWMSP